MNIIPQLMKSLSTREKDRDNNTKQIPNSGSPKRRLSHKWHRGAPRRDEEGPDEETESLVSMLCAKLEPEGSEASETSETSSLISLSAYERQGLCFAIVNNIGKKGPGMYL